VCVCVHLAVLGAVGGGLASSSHEWLLHRLEAVIAQRGIAVVAFGRCDMRPWHLESLGTLVKRQAAWGNAVADWGATEVGRHRALHPTSNPLSHTFRVCGDKVSEREDNAVSTPKPRKSKVGGVRTECTVQCEHPSEVETKLPPVMVNPGGPSDDDE
jgi:hypothetical protein